MENTFEIPKNTSNYTKEEKEKLIKKEIARLRKKYKDIDKEKMDIINSLIQNAAFMSVTLSDLQKSINLKGPISQYQNGKNQWGFKKSPEIETYNTIVKSYMNITKQLTDLLPKDDPSTSAKDKEADELPDFINRRDDA